MTNYIKIKSFLLAILFASPILVACKPDEPQTPGVGGGNGGGNKPNNELKIQGIALTAGAAGSFELIEGDPMIRLYGQNSIFGVCMDTVASGHIQAIATSDYGQGFGIALVKANGDKPDYNNFTSISVAKENGALIARVIDRQEGRDNVLDATGKISTKDKNFRYTLPLNDSYFSVPFNAANGKVMILRNDISGFFHFYVGVSKIINGVKRDNWMELAQSKDWNIAGTKFFITPIARTTSNSSSEIQFSNIKLSNKPTTDQVDANFAITNRKYTWAGFSGDATVISFSPKYNSALQGDRKFVFWSECNNVPAWHMNNEMLYSYEFAETWSDNIEGCFEPMSDRLLGYSKVEIVEDNSIRKTVKWSYALINPDYEGPYAGGAYPEVEEYYTLYPDGVGVRRIEYIQKNNSNYKYHELAEPLIIAGSSSVPQDHAKKPAMVVSNLSGSKYEIHPNKPSDLVDNVKRWSEQIYRARLSNSPDAFCVFSFSPDRKEVSPYEICNDFSWHNTTYQMSHWPVDKQKYLLVPNGDYHKSYATWPSQVSHSSLIGIEAKGGTDWNSNYHTNSDGNKYRVYLMLLGVVENDNTSATDNYTCGWLNYTISNVSGATFDASVTGYSKREIVLNATTTNIKFNYSSTGTSKNPVFRIDNWKSNSDVTLKVGDKNLVYETDYLAEVIDGSLIIWFNHEFAGSSSIEIN